MSFSCAICSLLTLLIGPPLSKKVFWPGGNNLCQSGGRDFLGVLISFLYKLEYTGQREKTKHEKNVYSQLIGPIGRYTGNKFLFKGLVINYGGGGATKWENRGSETFCATPSRQGKTFRAPPF